MRRRTTVVVLVATLASFGGYSASALSAGLPPLRGVPVASPTRLRLVVASDPPAIVDVDRQSITPVPGIAASGPGGVTVAPTENGALAELSSKGRTRAVAIGIDGTTRAVATGIGVAPAESSSAIWVLDRVSDNHCVLRRVPMQGRRVPVPCGYLERDGDSGVVIDTRAGELLADHATGRTRMRVTGEGSVIAPLHGDLVLENRDSSLADTGSLSLVRVGSGARRALRWPSSLGWLDGVVAEPGRPLVAVGFANPSTDPQSEDLFLLDTRTGHFTHVPGFPIAEDLKFSSMAWTRDGRLVLTAHLDDRTELGIYRPGDRAVSIEPLTMPPYTGSDAFVPLVTQG
jgi:hypothetical protein